ncbi:MAG: accessory gene regulator B family protein [Lachnospira eligens]
MIHSVALIIADFLFSGADAITEEEKEVCAYGMELITSGIISVALVLIIGLTTGNIWYALYTI